MDLKIMSRARPTDKQRLVQLLQQKGAVVAVTGDGTNDAPALNHAQVGLSMGTGTSVAKEASDITLLDDSFNSIGTAVMWGRSLYKKYTAFHCFSADYQFCGFVYRSPGLTGGYDASFDRHADVVGEPDYGYVCGPGPGVHSTQ